MKHLKQTYHSDSNGRTETSYSVKARPHRHLTTEQHNNYSGSGPIAFGAQGKWPVLSARVSFLQGEDELRDKLQADLANFVDQWLEQNLPEPITPVLDLSEEETRILYIISTTSHISPTSFGFSHIYNYIERLKDLKLIDTEPFLKLTTTGTDTLAKLEQLNPQFFSHLKLLNSD